MRKEGNEKEVMICPYCNKEAEWVENKEVYGNNLGKSFMIWLCRKCDAYVGCHTNSKKPLGTMADYETRLWRRRTHVVFDPLWTNTFKKNSMKKLNREAVYNRISNHFGFSVHIGESDKEMCKKIIAWCESQSKI